MEQSRHKRRFTLPRLALAAAAVAAIGGAVYLYTPVNASPHAAPAAPAAVPVSVAAALERRITEYDDFSGRLEAIDKVEVRPRVAGYIESIHFAPGALVKKGDTLFVIDPKPYAAEVARAEAALAAAQAKFALTGSELARAQRLLEDHAIAQREFEERVNARREAQAAIQSAQAALDIARLNLGYTRVTAPISGRVSRAEITVGNLVAAGAGRAVTERRPRCEMLVRRLPRGRANGRMQESRERSSASASAQFDRTARRFQTFPFDKGERSNLRRYQHAIHVHCEGEQRP